MRNYLLLTAAAAAMATPAFAAADGPYVGVEGGVTIPNSTNYDVTFPLFEKIDVNGEGRHPLYEQLTQKTDAEGKAGDIQWNFEKFLVSPEGEVVARFRPLTEPAAPELVSAVEQALPS